MKGRSRIGRYGGRDTRENAGISSEREARNLSVESLGFLGKVRPPRVSRGLSRGRKA